MTAPNDPFSPSNDDAPLDAQTTALLAARFRSFEPGAEHPEMELLSRYAAGDVTDAEADRARAILAETPELAEATALLMDMEGEQKVVSLGARRGTAIQRAALRRHAAAPRALWGAIAAVVIAAVGIGVFASRDAGPGDTGANSNMGAVFGGSTAGDQLTVMVRRDGKRMVLGAEGVQADAGEALEAHLAMPSGGHVAVIRYDGARGLTPIMTDSGGEGVGLDQNATKILSIPPVAEPPGSGQCQWVVAVFANGTFSEAALRDGLAQAAITTEDCVLSGLETALPFARSTRAVLVATP
ncbi:MAG: hypothetical protein ACI9MR_000554 [Myxococcota bacterium]|jgi:hypothetical protein